MTGEEAPQTHPAAPAALELEECREKTVKLYSTWNIKHNDIVIVCNNYDIVIVCNFKAQ